MFVFKVFFQLCFLSSHHRMDASTTQNFALILRSPWWPLAIKPIFPQPLTLYNSVTRKLLSYSPSHWSWEQWGRLVMSANLEIVQNSNRPCLAEIKFAPGPFSLTLKKISFSTISCCHYTCPHKSCTHVSWWACQGRKELEPDDNFFPHVFFLLFIITNKIHRCFIS